MCRYSRLKESHDHGAQQKVLVVTRSTFISTQPDPKRIDWCAAHSNL